MRTFARIVRRGTQAVLKIRTCPVLDFLLIFVGTLFVLWPSNPNRMRFVYRDSGVFLYIGWRILLGEVPYLHVWDHKPPIVFFINALGLLLSNGSRWGVWAIEFVFLLIASFLALNSLRFAMDRWTSNTAMIMFYIALFFALQAGNFTTEYALPMQFLAIRLTMIRDWNHHKRLTRWYILGLSCSIAFFLKQTSVGIWIAIVVNLIRVRFEEKNINQLVEELLSFMIGLGTMFTFWSWYFWRNNAFSEFFDAVWRYNIFYATEGPNLFERISAIVFGVEPLTHGGLFYFGIIGCVIVLFSDLRKMKSVEVSKMIFPICLIDTLIEFTLVAVAGRSYPHYFIAFLPSMTMLAALTIQKLYSLSWFVQDNQVPVFRLGFVLLVLWGAVGGYVNQARKFLAVNGQQERLEKILERSDLGDEVLFWGAEASMNFFARRASPTRFVYLYPLYTKGYVDQDLIIGFLKEVLARKPKLLVDTENIKTPMFEFPVSNGEIERLLVALRRCYPAGEELADWTAYEFVGESCGE